MPYFIKYDGIDLPGIDGSRYSYDFSDPSPMAPGDDGPTESVTFVYGALEIFEHTGGANFVLCDGSVRDEGFDDLAVDPTDPNTGHTPEWSNLRSSDPGLPAVQTDHAVTWTAIAMAESGGSTGAHNPHGEDSRGLWQINVDPAQRDVNPDTFDCSELVQWAGGTAVATETLTIAHEGWWLI